jgi:hypothetical protein
MIGALKASQAMQAAALAAGAALLFLGSDGAGVTLLCVSLLMCVVSAVVELEVGRASGGTPSGSSAGALSEIETLTQSSAALANAQQALIRLSHRVDSFRDGAEGADLSRALLEYALQLEQVTQWAKAHPGRIDINLSDWRERLLGAHRGSLV